MHIHTYVYSHIYMHAAASTISCVKSSSHIHTRTGILTYTHTYIRAYIHTHRNTYTHTYIHTRSCKHDFMREILKLAFASEQIQNI